MSGFFCLLDLRRAPEAINTAISRSRAGSNNHHQRRRSPVRLQYSNVGPLPPSTLAPDPNPDPNNPNHNPKQQPNATL